MDAEHGAVQGPGEKLWDAKPSTVGAAVSRQTLSELDAPWRSGRPSAERSGTVADPSSPPMRRAHLEKVQKAASARITA